MEGRQRDGAVGTDGGREEGLQTLFTIIIVIIIMDKVGDMWTRSVTRAVIGGIQLSFGDFFMDERSSHFSNYFTSCRSLAPTNNLLCVDSKRDRPSSMAAAERRPAEA
jgi:hypothetical protein